MTDHVSERTVAEAVDEALKQQTKDGWMRDAVLAVIGVLLRSGELAPREQLEEAVRAVLSHSDRAERAEAALEEARASQERMCDVADDLLDRAERAEAALAEVNGFLSAGLKEVLDAEAISSRSGRNAAMGLVRRIHARLSDAPKGGS